MQTIKIPKTDLTPSLLCLGGVPLGSVLDERRSFALLDAFVAQGGTFLDTARVYADWLPGERSTSEKTIGRWLKQRRQRHFALCLSRYLCVVPFGLGADKGEQ